MLRILLVEDNPADAQMFRTALGKTGMPVEMTHVKDGVEAIQYLAKNPKAPQHCDLVLLDLNLPLLSGFEVLDYLRSTDELKRLPVVIMSGSTNTEEIDRCYQCGANSYICKPIHLNEIFSTAAALVAYWSNCVKLPSQRPMARSATAHLSGS
jgi:CheY-like chemotaxis protein